MTRLWPTRRERSRKRHERSETLKLIGIGSNLTSPKYKTPTDVVRAALARLAEAGMRPVAVSRLFETAPVPVSDQPWYVNAVAAIETSLSPHEALAACMAIEAEFGRVRTVRNAARILDLDILAWDEQVIAEPDLTVPHPRMAERAFVLLPLADITPDWRHPETGRSISEMLEKLSPGQEIRPLRA